METQLEWPHILLLLATGYIFFRIEAALDRWSWRWCFAKVAGDVIHGTGRAYTANGFKAVKTKGAGAAAFGVPPSNKKD